MIIENALVILKELCLSFSGAKKTCYHFKGRSKSEKVKEELKKTANTKPEGISDSKRPPIRRKKSRKITMNRDNIHKFY